MEPGLLLTIGAILGWGVGDFLIQRSVKSTNKIITLFIIQSIGFLLLTPFAIGSIPSLLKNDVFSTGLTLIFITSFVTFVGSMLHFQSLKLGKISVIAPVFSLEILITALFSSFVLNESLTLAQLVFSVLLIIGITLVSIEDFSDFKNFKFEKGIGFAALATFSFGLVNFLFGFSSRVIDPIVVNWGVDFFLSVFCLIFMVFALKKSYKAIKANPAVLIGVSVADNIAWISFAIAMTLLPIAIVSGIGESYIVISVLLGVFFNKERLKRYQYLGLIIVVISAILLGATI